jgi:hypothetical protein
MRIKDNGYVGIGTSTPAYSLDVNGNAQVGFDSGNSVLIVRSGSCNVQLFKNGALGGIYESDNGRMNLTTNGNTDNGLSVKGASSLVGVNCNDPSYNLDVNGLVGIVTDGTGQLILNYTTAGKSVIVRNDGTNFYLLVGSSHTSGWNSLRPFAFNLTNGNVLMEHGFTVKGGIDMSNSSMINVSNLVGPSTGSQLYIKSYDEQRLIYIDGTNIGVNVPSGQFIVNAPISGNVGSLGTTAGNSQLKMSLYNSNGNNSYLRVIDYRESNGTDWFSAATRIQQRIDATDQAYLQFNGTSNAYGVSLATQNVANALVVKLDGKVGIGTWAPAYKLDVSGSINVTGGYYVNGVVLSGGGGGGGVSISGDTGTTGALLAVTGGGTGAVASSNLTFNSGILSLTGGFRLTNGFRPPYVEVKTGTSITPAADSYGTYYDIQTSAITGLSIGYPITGSNNWSNDSNAGWLFRNNSGSYLSLTVTYTSATPNIYPSNITIPPDTGVTLMAVYPGGGVNSNYVLF